MGYSLQSSYFQRTLCLETSAALSGIKVLHCRTTCMVQVWAAGVPHVLAIAVQLLVLLQHKMTAALAVEPSMADAMHVM